MSDESLQIILDKIHEVKDDLGRVETAIRNEMKLKHQAIEFKHKDHEKRLSFTEKMIFSTVGIILTAFIVALTALIFK